MILVGVLIATVWGIGAAMGAPARARWTMTGILLAAVIALHLILPPGHPLRLATGGDARLWLLILAFAGIAVAYGAVVRRLRARAVRADAAAPAPPAGTFSEAELTRYARHMMLREIGGPGQKRLKNARVLVIGAGGLGAPALLYLGAAGVGTIGVIDDDRVDASNLQRQIIHTDARRGEPKVRSAMEAIAALNPHVTVRPYDRRLTAEIADALFADYDLILDGTDSFAARYVANAAAVRAGKPLVGGALTQWEGQLSVWDPARGAPCYACIFPEPPAPGLVPGCAEAGVLGPLPGVIGAMMAAEAVKIITGAGDPLRGRLLIWDALYAEARVIALERRADCPVCGQLHPGGG